LHLSALMNLALAPTAIKTRQLVSALVALFVFLAAVGLALLGDRDARLAIGVVTLSAGSSDTILRLGGYLPLGFAFTAGMAAAVNPCGFGLLPGYLPCIFATAMPRPRGRAAHGWFVLSRSA
jgi:hypothetical protein